MKVKYDLTDTIRAILLISSIIPNAIIQCLQY